MARPVAYVGDRHDGALRDLIVDDEMTLRVSGALRGLIVDDQMTLPWGGRGQLPSARHSQGRPIIIRSAGWCAGRFNPVAYSPLAIVRGGRLWPVPRGGALVLHAGCAFDRSLPSIGSRQTRPASDRRRLRQRREDVGAGLCADLGDRDGGGRGVASRHPDHSRSALTSVALQRGIATDPLGPSLPLRSRSRAAESRVG